MNKFYTLLIFTLIAGFSPKLSLGQDYTFSYTYQNVTRINSGGTLEVGDTIEVRALMRVGKNATNIYYIDTIPAGMQYVNNSMKIVTNEGVLFRGTYTNTSNDDLGVYVNAAPSRLRINIGTGAANAQSGGNFGINTGGGSVIPGDKPKFYGNTLFMVAYRLKVTANFGDTVFLTGKFYYKDYKGANNYEQFNYAPIIVTPNQELCNEFSSASFTAESSFGQGIIQNRPAGVNAPLYTKVDMQPNHPQDNYYAVANNTSADGTTDNTGPFKPANNPHRVFGGFWDIIGDHTDAIDPLIGNPPVAPGTQGGYMLVVNAAFPTSEVYNDMIANVCPNTYYEFSAWIRNICGTCGMDSNSTSKYNPGVLPNLAFTINDVDYYTTGDIQHNNLWEKRGFIYKTGASETSFKITIKNNAPGGGGNDWVLDDIKLATCYPNLIMNPTDTARVCAGEFVVLNDTVRSYFPNYTNFCWEVSKDHGVTWTNTGNCGTKTPVLKNGLWEYIVDTTFKTVYADSGTFYRLKVATTASNLSNSNCSVDNSQAVFMKVFNVDCSVVSEIINDFKAISKNGFAIISWNSADENSVKSFEIERSADGIHFSPIEKFNPVYKAGGSYVYTDPKPLQGAVYYRLKINTQYNVSAQFSNVVTLYSLDKKFDISATNPFKSELNLNVYNAADGSLEINLFDSYGRRVIKQTTSVRKGSNKVSVNSVSSLLPGIYILRANMNGQSIQLKLVKN